jgi:hypothetical protein
VGPLESPYVPLLIHPPYLLDSLERHHEAVSSLYPICVHLPRPCRAAAMSTGRPPTHLPPHVVCASCHAPAADLQWGLDNGVA